VRQRGFHWIRLKRLRIGLSTISMITTVILE